MSPTTNYPMCLSPQPVPLDGPVTAPARGGAVSATATFEQAIADHHAAIRRLVFRLLGWSNEAEDVLQEVYLKAWRNWEKFRGQSEVRTWLVRIAINQCRSHQRRKLLGLRILTRLWDRSRRILERPANEPVVNRELAIQVRRAVARLRPRDREVIVLYYLEEVSVAQIAELLGATRAAVEVRLSRARERLRSLMANWQQE